MTEVPVAAAILSSLQLSPLLHRPQLSLSLRLHRLPLVGLILIAN